jgi:predicted RNA binding protein YcfA (HicA-like mRNA interferase family)
MPAFGAISRADLVRYLKQLGFDGPFPGGKHEYMVKEGFRLTIPNHHRGDIDKKLLGKLLKQAEISRDDWEAL